MVLGIVVRVVFVTLVVHAHLILVVGIIWIAIVIVVRVPVDVGNLNDFLIEIAGEIGVLVRVLLILDRAKAAIEKQPTELLLLKFLLLLGAAVFLFIMLIGKNIFYFRNDLPVSSLVGDNFLIL